MYLDYIISCLSLGTFEFRLNHSKQYFVIISRFRYRCNNDQVLLTYLL